MIHDISTEEEIIKQTLNLKLSIILFEKYQKLILMKYLMITRVKQKSIFTRKIASSKNKKNLINKYYKSFKTENDKN